MFKKTFGKIGKLLNVSNIIFTMVTIEFFINVAIGIIAPFFAIFMTSQIKGGTIETVGFAVGIFAFVKMVLQLPVAKWLDKMRGEIDDYWAFFWGYFVAAFVPLGYMLATEIWHVYALEAVYGIAFAVSTPAWYAIFTRHVEKLQMSFQWSLYSVISINLAEMIAAVGGGILVERFGFRPVFFFSSIVTIISALSILTIKKEIIAYRRTNKSGDK